MLHLALSGFERVQTYFSSIYRNTSSPWSSLQSESLMVHNNSQDQNISLLTDIWPWSMSRDLFGLILGIIYKLPHKVYFDSCTFFPFGIHKDSEMIAVVLFMFLCLLCKPPKLEPRSCEFFHTLLVRLQITRIWSWLMITHSRKSTLSVASYRLYCEDSLDVHTRWRVLELRFIIGAKTYDPINITSTFGNDNSVQQGKHPSSQTWCDEAFQLAVRRRQITTQLSLPVVTLCDTSQ